MREWCEELRSPKLAWARNGEKEQKTEERRVKVVVLLTLSLLFVPHLPLSLPFSKAKHMQSTLVGGSAARLQGAKVTLYVGGLSDNVNEAALHAAFIPFGEIKVN